MACPTNCCRSGAQQVTAISPPSAACHPRSIPTTPAMNSDSDARDSAGETRANRSRRCGRGRETQRGPLNQLDPKWDDPFLPPARTRAPMTELAPCTTREAAERALCPSSIHDGCIHLAEEKHSPAIEMCFSPSILKLRRPAVASR